jgi:AbrB family looped-hinge helix DNA binding protein
MTKIITVNERGALTLPKDVRAALGVTGGGQLVLNLDKRGNATLQPGEVFPVEIYTEERIREFDRMNNGPLAGRKLRRAKGR